SLADYSDTKVMEVLSRMRGSTSGVPIDTKSLEFQAFIGPTNTLSEDTENTHFLIRLLDASLWKNDTRLAGCLERIVLVDRMREVVAQVGFTRFESRGKSLGGELDLDLKPAPLAKDKIKIIPAYENRGEGIFLQFKPET